MTSGARLRLIAYGICALLTATCGDALVEALQNAGLFGATAIDRDQEGVAPVLTLAALLLVALGGAVVRDRYRRAAEAERNWLAAFAHDVSATAFASHLACIVAYALAVVCLIEGYERRFGGALPFAGAHATLTTVVASALIYVLCAAVVTVALSRCMRALAATCDAIARLVTTFATVLLTATPFAACRSLRDDAPSAASYAALLCRLFGDRAPPLHT